MKCAVNIEEGYVTPDVGVTFLKRRREPKPSKTPEKMQMHGTGRVWGLPQVRGCMPAHFEPPNWRLVTEIAVTSRILARR